ncbi:ABC transporter ATP-binding protein [Pelomonas sp. SE-A7]|uniref:ABC transporter ATP-binding protein n=1 Tax=Pelomonas sp. SE-A7 TaxID=3054953 RepID=UPI00259CB4FC|nr:ABC transporter ATP-binding protein [Pelomonas sp. SE-A7]MDM4765886.1 ABC transporter ATP-binding protein [Pelomonas sp. SE-A7]
MEQLAIETRGLRKRFGSVQAVDGLDLQVRRGEVFGLLGPNGAGKTTSMEMLEGISTPDEGELKLLGLDWRKDGAAIRPRIGVQFQITELDDRIKVREALELFSSYYARPRPVAEMLAQVSLQEQAESFQSKLSGGQRQRLALALALIHNPELVFLDEPTTGLDPQARQGLWDMVRQLKAEGRTVLLTTHYMEEAETLCDRVGIMDRGRLLEVGTPRELIAALKRSDFAEIEFAAGSQAGPQALAARTGLAIEAKAGHWEVALSSTQRDLRALLDGLEAEGLPMSRLHLRKSSLEDVFLHHTGRSLRD